MVKTPITKTYELPLIFFFSNPVYINEKLREEALSEELMVLIKTQKFQFHLKNEIKECIELHQNLKCFSRNVENLFSLIYLPIQLLAAFFLVFMTYGAVSVRAKFFL